MQGGSGKSKELSRGILVIIFFMLALHACYQADPQGYEAQMKQLGFERVVNP